MFKNYKKCLNLIAFSEENRSLWVDSLNFYIDFLKKNKKQTPEEDTENYFERADRSNDKKLDKNEINKFLDSINLKMDKQQLKDLFKV
jgi:Ca2+-binding EF-hand superfamily protein